MSETLLRLMIEADVAWPSGAEFAVQDNNDRGNVDFYSSKPALSVGYGRWLHKHGHVGTCVGVGVCANWMDSVSKAQFENAVALSALKGLFTGLMRETPGGDSAGGDSGFCSLKKEASSTLDALERPGIKSETRYVLDNHLAALLEMVRKSLAGELGEGSKGSE